MNLCNRFGEICYCCCYTNLPRPGWVVLIMFQAQYRGCTKRPFRGCVNWVKKLRFFTYYRQENKIFSANFHTTWEEPFSALYRLTAINVTRKGRIGRAEWSCPFCPLNLFPAHVYCRHPVHCCSLSLIAQKLWKIEVTLMFFSLRHWILYSSGKFCCMKPWYLKLNI